MAEEKKQIVNPWTVENVSDYNKLIETFGLEPIDQALVDRFERVTGIKAHHWLRRGIFYCHQGLNDILDRKEAGQFNLQYTGRGSSGHMHLGHLVPFLFTVYLQRALKCPLVIEMSDEEKFYFKEDLTYEQAQYYMRENVKDIIACGFDPEQTFIFSNFDYGGKMHKISAKLKKIVNLNQFKKIYGFEDTCNIGQICWPVEQIIPAFPEAFPHIFGDKKDVMCLVSMAVDQSPYFRCARDYAPKLGFPKPALLCGKFLPALQGEGNKMSTTGDTMDATIFLHSTPEEVKKKVFQHAFSGGQATAEDQRRLGANLTIDMSFQSLVFLEESDERLKEIADKYSKGQMLTSEIKQILVDKINALLAEHQRIRATITDDVVAEFMREKPLKLQ